MDATIITAIFGSVGLFSFIQFLIKRHDEKKGLMAWMKQEIIDLRKDMARDKADDARRRILAATDELRSGLTLHSLEWYNQLNEDIDEYENYCEDHPKYRNSKATLAVAYFKDDYSRRMKDNSFLG